jgi:hypothetical protein
LLHWICTSSSFTKLVFVPLLTPNDDDQRDGLTLHSRFKCQEFIRPFLNSLKEEPRGLHKIANLGTLDTLNQFEVFTFAPDRIVYPGNRRNEYWSGFDASTFENSIVFFDPDNGYETKTQHGPKWIRHDELKNLFALLPETSVALVYQHKPHRTWIDLFADLTNQLSYVHSASAVHDSTLAFVAMAGNANAGLRITGALRAYSANHQEVKFSTLF